MGTENEIKFAISPKHFKKLAASRFLRLEKELPAKQKYLVSTYFDTSKQKLKQNGVSLRVRQDGQKRLQTIKTARDGIASCRGELERKIDSDGPDLRAARGTALQPLITKKLKRNLKPIFATHVHRTVVPIRSRNGSVVELALDEGHVRGGRQSSPIAEVEVELKKGGVSDLFKAARAIAELVPVKLALKSKSQQGYDLIANQPISRVVAPRIVLKHEASLTDAFQTIGGSALWHLAANGPAVEAGDPEGVHQMRVGLRRLRVAISIFKDLLRCKQTDVVKRELKWLAGKLGPVRDLDVFLQTKVKRWDDADPPIRGLPDLTGELVYQRDLAIQPVRDAIASARYRFLIFKILEWIENGDWLRKNSSRGERRIKPFAAHLFGRKTRKAKTKLKRIGRLDSCERHKLRIAIKKLRYSFYFFESLIEVERLRDLLRYKRLLKGLQDNLGALNDVTVGLKLATNVANGKDAQAPDLVAFAAGVVAGSMRTEAEPLLNQAAKAARNLRRAKMFIATPLV
jgi:triphosphatase